MSWMNFNDAEQQTGDVIPAGTIAKVRLKIRPGGYDDPSQGWTDGVATRNEQKGSVYIDAEYTVMGGKYDKRKVWSLIGLHSPNGPKWAEMGRSFIRAALESARGIKPNDESEQAKQARVINSLRDLDGLEFVAKIDVEEGQNGYGDKNKINQVIPCTHKDYAAAMGGAGTGAAPSAASSGMAQPQQPAQQPAWMQG